MQMLLPVMKNNSKGDLRPGFKLNSVEYGATVIPQRFYSNEQTILTVVLQQDNKHLPETLSALLFICIAKIILY